MEKESPVDTAGHATSIETAIMAQRQQVPVFFRIIGIPVMLPDIVSVRNDSKLQVYVFETGNMADEILADGVVSKRK